MLKKTKMEDTETAPTNINEHQQQQSAAQGFMNDTAEAERIDAANQAEYDAQVDNNMNVEPFEEPSEEAGDDAAGFFSLKTILIIVIILFILLAIWYFFIRSVGGGDGDFGDVIEGGDEF